MNTTKFLCILLMVATGLSGAVAHAAAQPRDPDRKPEVLDWQTLEAPLLTEHVQITSRDAFIKAGEAYFDHASPPKWVVFQAIPVPPEGQEADAFYGMYVARLKYDGDRVVGIDAPILLSNPGSANTCGWFHPVDPYRVMFGSTVTAPKVTDKPGFRVGTRNYVWQFPEEMDIVERLVSAIVPDVPAGHPLKEQFEAFTRIGQEFMPRIRAEGNTSKRVAISDEMREQQAKLAPEVSKLRGWTEAQPIFTRPKYDAECSYSPDGRFILYTHVRENIKTDNPNAKDDGDIWIYDTKTQSQIPLVTFDGYDGGPFFSADGKRICYRSDRKLDDKLQIFVADLAFDAAGTPTGIVKEHAITADGNVNWAPYFHPSGAYVVYGSSGAGHFNYELFATQVPPAGSESTPAKLKTRRITQASGADVLPAFSTDGQWMIWTCQRGPPAAGETRPSSQVWVARVVQGPGTMADPAGLFAAESDKKPKPESGPAARP